MEFGLAAFQYGARLGQVENTFRETPRKYVHVGLDGSHPWLPTLPESVLNLSCSDLTDIAMENLLKGRRNSQVK
ncbi:hypothetical protein GCM10007071_10270 [Marinobacter zhanjiangensis]|uniref:Uncharacterized protein n=1 Tax=Marinobacter zhanjiangensis TaxID=578215 RepID=A0ABQ3AS19_9GAMM|nr:hypothetical protein GCM10007071_10270 [Marinobacter zhanjiangensis]